MHSLIFFSRRVLPNKQTNKQMRVMFVLALKKKERKSLSDNQLFLCAGGGKMLIVRRIKMILRLDLTGLLIFDQKCVSLFADKRKKIMEKLRITSLSMTKENI